MLHYVAMLPPNLVINGRYRLLGTLGVGGMGSVYATQDERLGRRVALKLLRSDLAQDQRSRERFIREAQIAAQLVHPNIVRTYDVGDAPEGPYLVQELLEGRTLDTEIPLTSSQTIQIALGVVEALNYLHSQGYVHCDIKPQNIMLIGPLDQPRVVLLDFGIARVAGTDTTTLIATPHYLAPERALGAAPTASSDLYALGIVLYHALTGCPPFDSPNLHAIIEQHRSAPLPPLRVAKGSSTAEEPHSLEAIIHKLSAKQPEQRYASAAAVRDDLLQLNNAALHNQATRVVAKAPAAVAHPAPAPRAESPPPALAGTATTSHKAIGLRYLAIPLLLTVLLLGAILARRGETARLTPPANGALATPVASVSSQQPQLPVSAPDAVQPSQAPQAPPASVVVPNVVGQSVELAQAQLQTVGLNGVVEGTIASEQPAGTVVSMSPQPDQPIAPGSAVLLQVSGGAPPAVAPPNNQGDNKDDKDDDKDDKDDDKEDKDKGNSKKKKKD